MSVRKKNSAMILSQGECQPNPLPLSTKGRFFLLFLLIFVVLLSFPLAISSRAQALPSSPIQPPWSFEIEKKQKEAGGKIWAAHRNFLTKGVRGKSQEELEKLYQWKLDQGIRNHSPLAAALIRESQNLERGGKNEGVGGLLSYAEKMAPDFSPIAYARARWIWSQRPFAFNNILKALWLGLNGFVHSFYDLDATLHQLANLTVWILFSFVVTFAAFAVYLLLRYYSFFCHHLKHLVRVEVHPRILGLLCVFFLLLPFFLGLGWMWLFALWLLVFWGYASRSDRTGIMALFLMLLLLPTGIRMYASLQSSMTDNGVPEVIRANTGVWSANLHRQLLTLHLNDPKDTDLLQAVGLIEKRMGKFKEAERHFLQWVELDPKSSGALLNLGNVYLATNRVENAVESYQKATQLDPSRTESYYNLGQAYLLNLLLQEADSEFRRARELRPQLISFYTSISSRNPNRMAIDQTIEPSRLWRRILADTPDREEVASGMWGMLWNKIPLKYGELMGAALLALLILLHWITKERPLIHKCEWCGQLICSRCTRSVVSGNQCSQCIKAFSTRTLADPQAVIHKKAQVARYQEKHRILPTRISLLLPGSGHLLRDRTLEGLVYLFIFILLMSKIFWWRGWVPSPMGMEASLDFLWGIVFGLIFLGYYGLVQYRIIRLRSKGGKFNFKAA